MTGMKHRLQKLEARHGNNDWREWDGRPVKEWPMEALESRIRFCLQELGLDPDTEITDEILESIARGDDLPDREWNGEAETRIPQT